MVKKKGNMQLPCAKRIGVSPGDRGSFCHRIRRDGSKEMETGVSLPVRGKCDCLPRQSWAVKNKIAAQALLIWVSLMKQRKWISLLIAT